MILSVRILDLVRKCHKKNIYFAKHQKHILVLSRIRIGSVFLKPDLRIRIRKKLTGSATLLVTKHYNMILVAKHLGSNLEVRIDLREGHYGQPDLYIVELVINPEAE